MAFDLSALERSLPNLQTPESQAPGTENNVALTCLPCYLKGRPCLSNGRAFACEACVATESPCFVFGNGKVILTDTQRQRFQRFGEIVESVGDVATVAARLELSLQQAMSDLEQARARLCIAQDWKNNLLWVTRRLAEGYESSLNLPTTNDRANSYAFLASLLPNVMVGRDFYNSGQVSFVEFAELYGVLKTEYERDDLSDYEITLLAYKVIRQQSVLGGRTDLFRDKKMASKVSREYLRDLLNTSCGLYD